MLPVAVFAQLHKVMLQHQFCSTAFVIWSQTVNYRFFTAAKIDIRVLLFGRLDRFGHERKPITHCCIQLQIFAAQLYAFPVKIENESM